MFLEEMRDAGGDIIGLDFHVELGKSWDLLGDGVGVQGNMDPVALYADLPFIRQRVQEILHQAAERPGHILIWATEFCRTRLRKRYCSGGNGA